MRRRRNCTALTIAALLLLPAGPARAAIREGDRFPSLSVETWEGSSTTFSAATDEVVILEFWASWCIPCHDALPTLAHLAAQYGDARLRVVLINIDQDHAAAEQKLSAVIPDRGRLTLLTDVGGDAMARLGAPGMPSTYVVANGVLQTVVVGFGAAEHAAIDAAVRSALNRKP